MSESANRETVERLIEGLNARDLELFHAQFHEDSIMEYPQSGERIVGGENRRGVYGVFVFELRDGRILSETAYFTQPFDPADWRAQWVERAAV